MAVQTALYSLRLAPIEAYFMSESVSLFLSRSRANGRWRAEKVKSLQLLGTNNMKRRAPFSVQDIQQIHFWTPDR